MGNESASSSSGVRFGSVPPSEHSEPTPTASLVASLSPSEAEIESSSAPPPPLIVGHEKKMKRPRKAYAVRLTPPKIPEGSHALWLSGVVAPWPTDPVDPPQVSAAPQPPPSAKTIVEDEPILIVPSPIIVAETIVSSCTETDVEHVRNQFHLPTDIIIKAMTTEERSNRHPYPSVAFNKAIMKHGARLPLHPLVRRVLAHFDHSPSQLNPNAYMIRAGMHILWRKLFENDLSMEEVCYLYKPSSKKSEVGYFFLALGKRKKLWWPTCPPPARDIKTRTSRSGVTSTPSVPSQEPRASRGTMMSLVSFILREFFFSFLCLLCCISSTNFFVVVCRVVSSTSGVRESVKEDYESPLHPGRI